MSVVVAMIAAVGENMAIGSDGELPWRLPTDFAHYKRTTMGKPLIMGRKTFESIGRPLPGRTNIVLSRDPGFGAEGIIILGDLDAAIAHGKAIAERDGVDEIFINGGAEIYRQGMERAERLYITHVEASPPADAFFPEIDPGRWSGRVIADVMPGENDSAAFTVVVYERTRQ